MERKKSFGKRDFETAKEMDAFLEKADLGIQFEKYGTVEKPKVRKVNIDLPHWLIDPLDLEAARAGVSRQPLIKIWLIQKLDEERKKRTA